MKGIETIGFAIVIFNMFCHNNNQAQPIPIELMLGYKYGAVNLAFSKNFSEKSRVGFFHMDILFNLITRTKIKTVLYFRI